MRLPVRPLRLFAPIALLVGFLVASCLDDPAGPPISGIGHFALAPSFQSSASGIVDLAQVSVMVTRISDETIALDTVVEIVPGSDSLDLALTVEVSSPDEQFRVTMDFVNPAGDTVFTGGPITVTASQDAVAAPEPVEMDIEYVGTGHNATAVEIAAPDTSAWFGDTLQLTASAMDDQGEVIDSTPIAWSSNDTLLARVPDARAGRIVCGNSRGAARIFATLLTDQADTIEVLVQPVPTVASISSGNEQAGEVGTELPQPVAVRVDADDELGVQGVTVIFSVADDGAVGDSAFARDTVLTDSAGVATTTWTLGSVVGQQILTATVSGIADSVLTFNALATAGEAQAIEIVSGDGQTATVGTTLPQPLVVLATDALGNPAPGAEVTWYTALDSGSVTPALDTTDSEGLASTSWTLGTIAGTNEAGAALTAFLPAPASADSAGRAEDTPPSGNQAPAATELTFTATGIPGTPAGLTFTQEPTSTTAGTLISIELAVVDEYGNTVTDDDTTNATLAIVTGTGTAGASLLGTAAGTATAGLVQLTQFSIDSAGTDYQLLGASQGLGQDTTQAFDVGPGAVAHVEVTPTAATLDALGADTTFSAVARDIFGNTATTSFTWELSDSAVASIEAGGVTTALANGTTDVMATADGVSSTASLTVNQVPSELLFSVEPSLTTTGDPIAPAAEVTILDRLANPIATASNEVTVAIAANPASGTLSGSTAVTASSGVAAFTDLTIDNIGSGYTLEASATGLVPDTSQAFDIQAPGGAVAWIELAGGNWSDPGNWSTGAVPGATDTVLIAQTGTYTVNLDVDATVIDLKLGGTGGGQTLAITGRTLTVDSSVGISPTGVLHLSGGVVNGEATIDVDGTINWSGGTIGGAGSTGETTIHTGGTLNVTGADAKYLNSHTLNNEGTIVWDATGTVFANNGPTLNNLALGSIDLRSDAAFDYSAGTALFSNAGTLDRTTGTGVFTIDVPFDNSSNVNVQSGTLALTRGGTSTGAFAVDAGTTLDFGGGTHTLEANSTVNATGRVSFSNDATVDIEGGYLVSGTTTIDNTAAANFNAASTSVTAGLSLINGTLGGSGTVEVSDSLYWSGGTMSGTGITTLYDTTNADIAAGSWKYLDTRTINNFGTVVWTADGTYRQVRGSNGAVFNNLSSGVFDAQSAAEFTYTGTGTRPTFANDGTVSRTVSTGVFEIQLSFDNSTTGTVSSRAGTLSFSGGGTSTGEFTVEAGATIDFGGGAQTLDINSSITGAGDVSFTNDGFTTIQGSYNITGATVIDNTATAEFSSVGPSVTARLSLLSGTLSGTGTLEVSDSLYWSGGTMGGSGVTTLYDTTNAEIAAGTWKYLDTRTINNYGTVVWTADGTYREVRGSNGAVFNNLAGAVFDAQSVAEFSFTGTGTRPIFANDGTVSRTGTTGPFEIQLEFNNRSTGTVEVESGTLNLTGGGTSTGAFATFAGGTIDFGGGVHTLDAASAITGDGGVSFTNDGATTIEGSYAVTGTTIVDNTATVNFNAATTSFTAGLSMFSGTLSGTGTVEVSDSLYWSGGTMGGAGVTTLHDTTIAEIAGGNWKYLDTRTINNYGTVVWTADGTYREVRGSNGAVFNNLVGAVFEAQSVAEFTYTGTGTRPTFANDGTVSRTVSAGVFEIQLEFNNSTSGIVDGQSGTLSFSGGGTSTGAFTTVAGATLDFGGGVHTLDADATVSGTGGVSFTNDANTTIEGAYDIGGTTTIDDNAVAYFNSAVGAAVTARLTLLDGVLSGTSTVEVSDSLHWAGGTMGGTGTTTLYETTNAAVVGGAYKYLTARTLNNAGTVVWTAAGTYREIRASDAATINNQVTGVLDLRSDAELTYYTGTLPTLVNSGTVRRTTSTGTFTIQIAVDNGGTVSAEAGTLSLEGGGTSGGVFTSLGGATLEFGGGAHTLGAASSVGGDGIVAFTGTDSTTIDGGYDLTGTTVIDENAVVDFNAATSVTAGLSMFVNGTLTGAGTVEVSDSLHWSGGDMTGSGITILNDTTSSAIVGGYYKDIDARTIQNSGTVVWTADGTYRQVRANNGATFENLAAGVFDVQSDAELTYTGTGVIPTFSNAGTVTRTVSTGTFTFDVNLTNSNVLDIQTGTLAASRAFSHESGAVLQGEGTLDASAASSVTMGGALNPGTSPGILGVNGDFTADPTVAFNIEIEGTTAGTDYDRIVLGGATTLGGALNVTLPGAYTPVLGDTFAVMTLDGAWSGDFASTSFPDIGILEWETLFTAGQSPDTLYLIVNDPLGPAPEGTETVWLGLIDSDWDNPGNWTYDDVPDDTMSAFIRASTPYQPTTTGNANVDTLLLEAGATLTIAANDTLAVQGDLDAGYSSISGAGTVALVGTGMQFFGTVPNLLVSGSVLATDSVSVTGNLEVSGAGASLDAGGQRVMVSGDLQVGDGTVAEGSLVMQNAADSVVVGGGVTFQGTSTGTDLSAGALDIKGNFAQNTIGGVDDNFTPSGTHTTIFSDSSGTLEQNATFQAIGTSHFNNLRVHNATGYGLEFSSNVDVLGDLEALNTLADIIAPGQILSVGGAVNSQAGLTLGELTVGGALTVGGTYAVTTTVFTGTGQVLPEALTYDNVIVTGSGAAFVGATTITGDLTVQGGGSQLDVGGQFVTVEGNLFVGDGSTADGWLVMQSPTDSLVVLGNATFRGASAGGTMTAGGLEVGGNFAQTSIAGTTDNFQATGTHTTYFPNGGAASPQEISFSDPVASYFHNFSAIGGGAGDTLLTDATVNGDLSSTAGIHASDRTLTVLGDYTNSAGTYLTELAIGGVLNATGTYSVTTTTFTGTAQTIPATLAYQNIAVTGTATLGGTETVQDVTVAAGATLDLGANDLMASGNVDAGNTIIGTGTLVMSGMGTTVTGTVSNLDIQNDVTLSGPVTVTDTAGVGWGRLTLDGNTMEVGGPFSTTGSGVLVMTNTADVMNTTDVTFDGTPSDGYLTAGTLYVSGDFVQGTTGSPSAFGASGTHTTVFNGTGVQYLQFSDPGAADSRFQNLSVTNTAILTPWTSAHVLGDFVIHGDGNLDFSDYVIAVDGSFSTAENGTLSMTLGEGPPELIVAGNVEFGGGSTGGLLTDGTITVRGDFTQTGDAQSFAPDGNHSTFFNSDAAQTISFTNPDTLAGSYFANLNVQTLSSGSQGYMLTLSTDVYVTGNATLDPNGPDQPAQLNGLGELIVSGSIGFGSGGSNIAPAAVRVGGALNLIPAVTYGAAVTEFFGSDGQSIPMRTDYQSVLITGDSVNFDFTGSATINGDLTIAGTGLLDIDSATTTVTGNLVTQDGGRLIMDDPFFGSLSVEGDATFGGGDTEGLLTEGELKVAGNFTQGGATTTSFAPSANHWTRLYGNTAQTVSFASPGAAASRFGILDLINHTLPVDFTTDAHVLSTLTLVDTSGATTDSIVAEGVGTITVDGNISVGARTKLRPSTLRAGAAVTVTGTLEPSTIEFFGSATQYPPSVSDTGAHYTDVLASGSDVRFLSTDIGGSLTVSGTAGFDFDGGFTMDVGGDVLISGTGLFALSPNVTVNVTGGLTTENNGTLSMASSGGIVDVAGNAVFGGGSTSGQMSSGTLYVAGDFSQLSTTNSTQSFAPLDGHTTVFDGTGAQLIHLDDPSSSSSHFDALRIDNLSTGGVVLDTDIFVYSSLLTPADATSRSVFGQGNAITAHGMQIQNLVMENAPLVIAYDGDYSAFTSMSSTTFQGMTDGVTQFTLSRASGFPSFGSITFDEAVTGLFIHVIDINVGEDLSVNFDCPSPADLSGRIQEDNTATVTYSCP